MNLRVSTLICGAVSLASASSAFAQSVPLPVNIGDAVRQGEQARMAAPPRPVAAPVLPQLAEKPFALADKATLFVRRFEIDGPGLVESADIRAALAPFERRKLTITEIYAAAEKITTLYRAKGYLVAKAYVPAQDARRGTLRVKILAGRWGETTLQNASLVGDNFLRGVIDAARADAPFIHKDPLENSLLRIGDLPGAATPRIIIGAGGQPEATDLVYAVPEGRRFDGFLSGDNFGSPYTGRDRLNGAVNINSPLGISDRLEISGIVAERAHLANSRVAYGFPIGYDGLRGEIGAFRTTYKLGGVYKDLDAAGSAYAVTGTVSYPVQRHRDESIYVAANFTYKWLNDKVGDASIAYRAVALGTVSINRDAVQTLFGFPIATTANLSFSTGNVNYPDALQALANRFGADTQGAFYKINLSTSAAVALDEKFSFSTSLRAQKSLSRNLDTSEQIGVSGFFGVRSFDEGLAGDSGLIVTPELRYSLPEIFGYRHSAGVFTDIGAAWIENASYTVTQKSYTPAKDVGLSYRGDFEFSPGSRFFIRAEIAHSYGERDKLLNYDRRTKGLVQIGVAF